MASSKNWALYASVHREGTIHEHRLAGARIFQLGVQLEWHLPQGWTATFHASRFALQLQVAPRQGDQRMDEYIGWLLTKGKEWPKKSVDGMANAIYVGLVNPDLTWWDDLTDEMRAAYRNAARAAFRWFDGD